MFCNVNLSQSFYIIDSNEPLPIADELPLLNEELSFFEKIDKISVNISFKSDSSPVAISKKRKRLDQESDQNHVTKKTKLEDTQENININIYPFQPHSEDSNGGVADQNVHHVPRLLRSLQSDKNILEQIIKANDTRSIKCSRMKLHYLKQKNYIESNSSNISKTFCVTKNGYLHLSQINKLFETQKKISELIQIKSLFQRIEKKPANQRYISPTLNQLIEKLYITKDKDSNLKITESGQKYLNEIEEEIKKYESIKTRLFQKCVSSNKDLSNNQDPVENGHEEIVYDAIIIDDEEPRVPKTLTNKIIPVEETVGHRSAKLNGIYVARDNNPLTKIDLQILNCIAIQQFFISISEIIKETSLTQNTVIKSVSNLKNLKCVQTNREGDIKITPQGHYNIIQSDYEQQ